MNERELLAQLAQPFAPKHLTWKPGATSGEKCLALAYADLRAYQERLDEICGLDWSIEYVPWGDSRVIARLTIAGITRSSTGEMSNQDIKNEMGGTVAEAQAMKRAAAQFGLGRYLYDLPSVWVAFDASKKRITEQGRKELDSRYAAWYSRQATQTPQNATEGADAAETGKRATEPPNAPQGDAVPPSEGNDESEGTPPHNRCFGMGASVFGPAWNNGGRKWLLKKWSSKATPGNERDSLSEFNDAEKDQLADYMTEHAKELQRIWRKYEAEKVAA